MLPVCVCVSVTLFKLLPLLLVRVNIFPGWRSCSNPNISSPTQGLLALPLSVPAPGGYCRQPDGTLEDAEDSLPGTREAAGPSRGA